MAVKAEAPVKLLSAWFCPYAQRAWVAAEEKGLVRGVDYEVVEALSLPKGSSTYIKDPVLLKANPKGLVPVILDQRSSRHEEDRATSDTLGTVVCESLACVQYIEEAFDTPVRLLPDGPGQRATCRVWFDWIDMNICTPFYKSIVLQDKHAQAKALNDLTAALGHFATEMKGPFFLGQNFTAVDIAIVPWMVRLPVLTHYRKYTLPDTGDFPRLKQWIYAALKRPSVKATLADTDRLIEIYQRYADGTAKSMVGDRIRAGKRL